MTAGDLIRFTIKRLNGLPAVFTSTASRDAYFASNPDELTAINNRLFAVGIGPVAEDPSQGNVTQWYAYIAGAWETIVATLVGATGLTGSGADLTQVTDGHIPVAL